GDRRPEHAAQPGPEQDGAAGRLRLQPAAAPGDRRRRGPRPHRAGPIPDGLPRRLDARAPPGRLRRHGGRPGGAWHGPGPGCEGEPDRAGDAGTLRARAAKAAHGPEAGVHEEALTARDRCVAPHGVRGGRSGWDATMSERRADARELLPRLLSGPFFGLVLVLGIFVCLIGFKGSDELAEFLGFRNLQVLA